MNAKRFLTSLFTKAGIEINGLAPWDIQVHNEIFYESVLKEGIFGLGQSYAEGIWDCEAIDILYCKGLRAEFEEMLKKNITYLMHAGLSTLFNSHSLYTYPLLADPYWENNEEFFKCITKNPLLYSCGYWKNAHTLEEAQNNKLELICKKLQLKPNMLVLDIGSGWGELSAYMAKNYHVQVVALTLSYEQYKYCKQKYQNLPIEWRLEDYREHINIYDRIVSVGMFESVGQKNFDLYFSLVKNMLKSDGLFLLDTIGINSQVHEQNKWIFKHFFPYNSIPTFSHLSKAIQSHFIMEDWHNFGADYDKTLLAWDKNLLEGYTSKKLAFTEKTLRTLHYYFNTCAGTFRSRNTQLWQIVLSPEGVEGGYCCRE